MPAESYFFVDQTNETVGPISWEVLLQLANAGAVSAETPTASGGSSDWVPFSELRAHVEARLKLPPVPGSKVGNLSEGADTRTAGEPRPADEQPGKKAGVRPAPLEETVRKEAIQWDAALLLTALVTSLGMSSDIATIAGKSAASEGFAVVGLLVLIPAVIFGSILHYRCWHALPIEYRATSPGKAVGYLFIPFYNLYWAFISWVKLADGYEGWQRESNITGPHGLKGLGVTQAVFFCLPFLLLPALPLFLQYPILSIAFGVASLMVFGFFYSRTVTAANRLISGRVEERREGGESKSGWSAGGIVFLVVVSGHFLRVVMDKTIHPFFIATGPLVLVFLLVRFLKRK